MNVLFSFDSPAHDRERWGCSFILALLPLALASSSHTERWKTRDRERRRAGKEERRYDLLNPPVPGVDFGVVTAVF